MILQSKAARAAGRGDHGFAALQPGEADIRLRHTALISREVSNARRFPAISRRRSINAAPTEPSKGGTEEGLRVAQHGNR